MAAYLFVYGSLRRQAVCGAHDRLARRSNYVGMGYMQGRLYEVDGYPGAICSDDGKVHGELYRIIEPSGLFALLDDYEECAAGFPLPHEYVRRPLPIQTAKGDVLSAWVYLYNRDVTRLKLIPSGDYFQR